MKMTSREFNELLDMTIQVGRNIEESIAAMKQVLASKEREIIELKEMVRKACTPIVPVAPTAPTAPTIHIKGDNKDGHN